MEKIHIANVSEEFVQCWRSAGRHIQTCRTDSGNEFGWLRAHLYPPFLEHLSFRLRNQLFFIQLEDVDQNIEIPGNKTGLFMVAEGCKGHACIMPLLKSNGEWHVATKGWGLLDARTYKAVDPSSLVTDELIEITDWELQDFAVQIVREHLEKEGHKITAWQSNPDVDPSIWFVGPNGPEWVVVRAARYPAKIASQPDNLEEILQSWGTMGVANFASVAVANAHDPFDPLAETIGNFIPIYRGMPAKTNFEGLQPL